MALRMCGSFTAIEVLALANELKDIEAIVDTALWRDNTSVSGNTGSGVYVSGRTFTKSGGTIYGSNETDAKLRNTASRGHAVYNGSNWRNATAGPTMNTDTFGFWMND